MSRIVLMDDDADIAETLCAVMESRGHRVWVAENGREGLEVVARVRPDLALVDVLMPGTGGLDVVRTLRADPELRSMPVILMSGGSPDLDATELRGCEFLTKPFSVPRLLGLIERLTGGAPGAAGGAR